MILHTAPNTCGLATHITLIEAGADFELQWIDFATNGQRRPDYLELNPHGRAPALVTQQGVLTETPALLAYVAQRFPGARLAPIGDHFTFGKVQAFNSYLCSTVHVAHAHRMRGRRWVDDPAAIAAMQRKVPASVTACFELIERHMLKGPWVMGEAYTICDPYLFTLSQWLEVDGADLTRLPRVLEHRARVNERPAVQRALREERAVGQDA